MESERLKKEMMRLWKDTFHDSDRYINLIFDRYFDPDMVEYYEQDDRIVSALLAIPYRFGSEKGEVKGLYLCGLATENKFRQRGIMSDLIEKISVKAIEKGYSFVFLIPASSGLIKYYEDRGFVNAFYRKIYRYTSIHNFENEYKYILESEKDKVSKIKEEYFNNLKMDIIDSSKNISQYLKNNRQYIDKIISFIQGQEKSNIRFEILHSSEDIKTIIEENIISGGKTFISSDSDGEITGIAFAEINGTDKINIAKVYASDKGSLFRILESVKREYPERSMVIFSNPWYESSDSIWEDFYIGSGKNSNSVKAEILPYSISKNVIPYGMMRILNLYEILKFLGLHKNDLKYSILVKEVKPEKIFEYRSRNGSVTRKLISECESREADPHPGKESESRGLRRMIDRNGVMSVPVVGSILFRRPSNDSIITEAFGLPALEGNISLMLD